MLCFNSHTQQQKQCIYKMILQAFIKATQRRITLRLFQNKVIVMKSLNNLTTLLYFNQCSSAEQVERLVLTGRNLPLGDGWACQITDSLIKSIDSEFNFSDRIMSSDACADICSLISLQLRLACPSMLPYDVQQFVLTWQWYSFWQLFIILQMFVFFSGWGLVISILHPVQETATAQSIHTHVVLLFV